MGTTISANLPAQPAQISVAQQATVSSSGETGFQSPTSPASASSPGPTNNVPAPQFESQLNDTLRTTGFKAEVDTSTPGQTVVRIVDNVTGKLVVQMPSANALAVAEALRKSAADQEPIESGAILDEAA
jgi:hypothetical protein